MLLNVDYLWVINKDNPVPSCHVWAPCQEHQHEIQDPFFADTLMRITSRLCQAILSSPWNHDYPNSIHLLLLLLWPQNIQDFTLNLLAASKSFAEAYASIWTVANFIYLPSTLKMKNNRKIKFGEWTETCTLAPGGNTSKVKADFQGIFACSTPFSSVGNSKTLKLMNYLQKMVYLLGSTTKILSDEVSYCVYLHTASTVLNYFPT